MSKIYTTFSFVHQINVFCYSRHLRNYINTKAFGYTKRRYLATSREGIWLPQEKVFHVFIVAYAFFIFFSISFLIICDHLKMFCNYICVFIRKCSLILVVHLCSLEAAVLCSCVFIGSHYTFSCVYPIRRH